MPNPTNKAVKPVAGKYLLHIYRLLKYQASQDAKRTLFATEDSEKIANDVEETTTKDGTEVTPAGGKVTLSSSGLLPSDDSQIKEFKNACKKGELVESWVVNTAITNDEGKHPATYYQGYFTSFESGGSAEGFAEVSTEYSARGTGVDGYVTLDADQEEEALYTFEQLSKKGA